MKNAACSFCTTKENKDREIIRTKFTWAFPTYKPIVPGHTLICPIRCVATFEELTEEEREDLFSTMDAIKASLRKNFSARGFNHAWNEDEVGGQTVPHFHLHVLPRTHEDEVRYGYEPRKFIYRAHADRTVTPQQELEEVARLIAKGLP